MSRLGMFYTIHVSAVVKIGITDHRNWIHDSAGAHVIGNCFSWGVCAAKVSSVFRKKTSFSFVCCMNVLHHVDKKALCSMSVLKSG